MADTLSCQWETLHSQKLRSIKKELRHAAAATPPSSVMNSRLCSGRYRDHCQGDF